MIRNIIWVFLCFSLSHNLLAQEEVRKPTRFIAGLSGPELLHIGITQKLSNSSQLGFSVGVAPTWGGIWPSFNIEHRLYFGGRNPAKSWFFRQGSTFFPSARKSQKFTLNLTVGKDFSLGKFHNGLTIDLGVFHLPESESSSLLLSKSLNLWPALRFEFYFPL